MTRRIQVELKKTQKTVLEYNRWNAQEKKLIKRKDIQKQKLIRSRSRDIEEYKKLQRELNEMLEWIKERISTNQENGSPGLSPLLKRERRQRQPHAPIRAKKGFKFTDEQKTEAIAEHLMEQFSIQTAVQRATGAEVRRGVRQHANTEIEEPRRINTERVKNKIKLLKTKNAPGKDGILNRAIKLLPETAQSRITGIINGMLRTGYYPERWKKAIIITIPKKEKDPTQIAHRRPISPLNGLAKIAEGIINEEIREFIEERKILPPSQMGLRMKIAANLEVSIWEARRLKHHTFAPFLNVEKAYNKVWSDGATFKL